MKPKSNETAIRALETLKNLCFDEYTQEELIELIFDVQNSDNELRIDSLYKYLNTFKVFGMDVVKNKGKLTLDTVPIKTTFTSEEKDAIKFLYAYSQKICPQSDVQKFKDLLNNLLKNSADSVDLQDITTKSYLASIGVKVNKDKLERFKSLCKDNQRISFDYFNKVLNKQQSFIVEPLEVFVTPTGGFLKAFNPEIAEIQNFQMEDISEVAQLPVMAKSINVKNSVTFSLKGRLALLYELKQGERIINKDQACLVISSSEEDKNELIKRLLRYGTACEILYPKTFKQKFVDTLNKIRALYK